MIAVSGAHAAPRVARIARRRRGLLGCGSLLLCLATAPLVATSSRAQGPGDDGTVAEVRGDPRSLLSGRWVGTVGAARFAAVFTRESDASESLRVVYLQPKTVQPKTVQPKTVQPKTVQPKTAAAPGVESTPPPDIGRAVVELDRAGRVVTWPTPAGAVRLVLEAPDVLRGELQRPGEPATIVLRRAAASAAPAPRGPAAWWRRAVPQMLSYAAWAGAVNLAVLAVIALRLAARRRHRASRA
jgi:hypothetical protein